MEKEHLDLLKKMEELTARLNQIFSEKGKSVFARYPMTFALLVVFGVTMVSQGVKDLLLEIKIFENQPWIMLVAGIIVLIITGTLYKKLNK
jgi:uncharacterized membrane protein HdeD (DUF308 family)